MLNFIMLTLSIALGIIISYGALILIMMNPKVMIWYTNKMLGMTEKMFNETRLDDEEEES